MASIALDALDRRKRMSASTDRAEEARKLGVKGVLVEQVDAGGATAFGEEPTGVALGGSQREDGPPEPQVLVGLGGNLVVAGRALQDEEGTRGGAILERFPIRQGRKDEDEVLEIQALDEIGVVVRRSRSTQIEPE